MIISPKEYYENLKDGSDKKVKLKCNMCGKITETAYHNYTRTQKKNNRKGETFCKSCATKNSGEKRRGRPSPFKGTKRPNMQGEFSPTWKGGEYIDVHGYKMKYVGCDKRNRTRNGWSSYKKEHILVIEEYIGRKLEKGEVIHHIDGNKLNNSLDNLVLLKREKNHRVIHNSLQEVGYELYNLGIIVFNRDKERYEMAHIKFRELLEHLGADNQQPNLSSNAFEGSETSSET